MHVSFHLVSFRLIWTREYAEKFLSVIKTTTGIFVPDRMERGGSEKEFSVSAPSALFRAWKGRGVVQLSRSRPYKVLLSMDLADDTTVEVLPNHLFATVDTAYFGSGESLSEMVQFGSQLYRLFSPCYCFITLPWMPSLGAVTRPFSGLPGWGWATWLGPEYNELVVLESSGGLFVEDMPDGGKLYLCAWPKDVSRPDAQILAAYTQVVNSIEPDLFQPAMPEVHTVSLKDTPRAIVDPIIRPENPTERTKPARTPKFRFDLPPEN